MTAKGKYVCAGIGRREEEASGGVTRLTVEWSGISEGHKQSFLLVKTESCGRKETRAHRTPLISITKDMTMRAGSRGLCENARAIRDRDGRRTSTGIRCGHQGHTQSRRALRRTGNNHSDGSTAYNSLSTGLRCFPALKGLSFQLP